MTAKLQVLASPAPVPVEVICRWLREEARRAILAERSMELSPLTALRIAAELEARLGDSSAGGRISPAVAAAPGEPKAQQGSPLHV